MHLCNKRKHWTVWFMVPWPKCWHGWAQPQPSYPLSQLKCWLWCVHPRGLSPPRFQGWGTVPEHQWRSYKHAIKCRFISEAARWKIYRAGHILLQMLRNSFSWSAVACNWPDSSTQACRIVLSLHCFGHSRLTSSHHFFECSLPR